MKKLGYLLLITGMAACQTPEPVTTLANCAAAQTEALTKACQEQHVEDLQNLRQDIRKTRRSRRP